MAKYITDEVKKLIGSESRSLTYDVERGDIRLFAEAIDDPNPLFSDEKLARNTRFGGVIGSPTFARLLLPPMPRMEFQIPSRTLDGGSEWEYFEPIRPGDKITVTTRLADLRESEGRLGTMIFIVLEVRYVNQFGELCQTQRITYINY